MVRRLGLGKNNHLTYDSLALNPRYMDILELETTNLYIKVLAYKFAIYVFLACYTFCCMSIIFDI